MANDRYRLDYTGAQINKAIKNALNIPNCCKNLSLGIGDDGLVYIFADGVPIGNGIEITGGGSGGITYTVTYDLYDVTSSNTDTTISKGAAFETVLSVASGYMIPHGNVVVTMGGENITATARSC